MFYKSVFDHLHCFTQLIPTIRLTGRNSHRRTMSPPTEEDEHHPYDDAMADVTTEHSF